MAGTFGVAHLHRSVRKSANSDDDFLVVCNDEGSSFSIQVYDIRSGEAQGLLFFYLETCFEAQHVACLSCRILV